MDRKLFQGIVKNKQKMLCKSIFKAENFIAGDKLFLQLEDYSIIYFLWQQMLYSINSKSMFAIQNKRLQFLRLPSNFKVLYMNMQIYVCAFAEKI